MNRSPGDRFHFRTAPAEQSKVGAQTTQRLHQRRAVIVAARFARDEVDRHFFGGTCFRTFSLQVTMFDLRSASLENSSPLIAAIDRS